MVEEFELAVAGSPDDYLAALAAYGRDWRESRLPARLRAGAVYGCTVSVRGVAFAVRLKSGRRGPGVYCTGEARPGPDGATRLSARVGLTPASKRLDAVWFGGLTVLCGWIAAAGGWQDVGIWAFWALAMTFQGGAALYVAYREIRWHAPGFRELLARAAPAQASPRSPAA